MRCSISLVCVAALISSCGGGGGDVAERAGPVSYTVNVTAARPAVIADEGLTVALSVVADSRCPVNAMCISAGDATVDFSVTQAGYPRESIRLKTGGPTPAPVAYRSFQLSLSNLQPLPVANRTLPLEAYGATVLVERH